MEKHEGFTTINTLIIISISSVIFLTLVIGFFKKSLNYWKKKNVPYLESDIFGDILEFILRKESTVDQCNRLYTRLSPHTFAGFYSLQKPKLMIRDPELIKRIMTKDFEHFRDRNLDIFHDNDLLLHNLFTLTGEKWRNLRTKITPAFTSGKMKFMFPLMKECATGLEDLIGRILENRPNELIEIKSIFSRYSTDVISSCAFGLQSNTLTDENTEFRKVGQKIFQNSIRRRLFAILAALSPLFSKKLRFFDDDLTNFFLNFVRDTIKYPDDNNVMRNDFIQLLMELRNKKITNSSVESSSQLQMTTELMAAQCFIFFLAGFETSSTVLSFCLLELSRNPEIQDKLREEVNQVLNGASTAAEITYTDLQKMIYMDKVILEAMRLYPALSILTRHCNKKYEIPDSNVTIEPGTEILIPVYGIQRDPQHFPNPDEFNPENFSEQSKLSRHPYTHLPFGEGPRVCIGSRFGLMQVKLALATLIIKYEFKMSSKTIYPVEYRKITLSTSCANGIWLITNKCTEE